MSARITKFYAVYDSKLGFYGTPNSFVNDAEAIRAMNYVVMEEGTMLSRNPEDFHLYCVGSYNTDTGEIEPEAPRHVAHLLQLRQAMLEKQLAAQPAQLDIED